MRDDSRTLEKLSWRKHRPVTIESAEKVAKKVGAVKYVECSALTQKGLKNVFIEAISAALKLPEPVRKRKGVLLRV